MVFAQNAGDIVEQCQAINGCCPEGKTVGFPKQVEGKLSLKNGKSYDGLKH